MWQGSNLLLGDVRHVEEHGPAPRLREQVPGQTGFQETHQEIQNKRISIYVSDSPYIIDLIILVNYLVCKECVLSTVCVDFEL